MYFIAIHSSLYHKNDILYNANDYVDYYNYNKNQEVNCWANTRKIASKVNFANWFRTFKKNLSKKRVESH